MNISDIIAFKENEILRFSKPESLFIGAINEKQVKQAYIKLSFKWHPDHNKNNDVAQNVFTHINLLYKKAKEKFKGNLWNKGLIKEFIKADNTSYTYEYIQDGSFELGTYLITKDSIIWIFDESFQDLAKNSIKKIENIKFANDNMKKEMEKYVPKIMQYFITKNNQLVIEIKRDEKGILLSDILKNGKKIEVKHVAWILSNCYNLACFMKFNNIMHGGFSIENIFINPENHSAQLLGGWWFTHQLNEKLTALNSKTLDIAPFEVINSKKALDILDLDCIRLIGRELLRDKSGFYLTKNNDIPKPLITWLRGASKENAIKEYENWQQVLKNSFGERRFVKMDLRADDIYN